MIIKLSFNVLTYHFCRQIHIFFVFKEKLFLASLCELNIEINEHIIELTSCLTLQTLLLHYVCIYSVCVCVCIELNNFINMQVALTVISLTEIQMGIVCLFYCICFCCYLSRVQFIS